MQNLFNIMLANQKLVGHVPLEVILFTGKGWKVTLPKTSAISQEVLKDISKKRKVKKVKTASNKIVRNKRKLKGKGDPSLVRKLFKKGGDASSQMVAQRRVTKLREMFYQTLVETSKKLRVTVSELKKLAYSDLFDSDTGLVRSDMLNLAQDYKMLVAAL